MAKKIIIGILVILAAIIAIGAFSGEKPNKNERTNNTQNEQITGKDASTDMNSGSNSNSITYDSLPEAPSGYTWYHCKGFDSYVLKPDGWYTKDETKEDTEACFVTKEQIVSGGMFQTGMSINAVPNIPNKTGSTPSAYAQGFFDAAKSKMDVQNYNVTTQGGLKVHSATLYPPKTGNDEAIVLYQIVAANDTTGSIFIITFESPASKWDTFMPMVTTMTQNLALNGNF